MARLMNNRNKPAPLGHERWGGRPKGWKPPENWYTVPKMWQGQTCFILAGGPSLQGFNADCIQNIAKVIAINDSYRLAPYGDVLYWTDLDWWKNHNKELSEHFAGFCVGLNHPGLFGTKSIKDLGQIGLSEDPTGLCRGNDSGYAAINLAYLFGAKRICLMGYDMGSKNGRTHWHQGHPWNPETAAQMDQKCATAFLPLYPYLREPLEKAGVEVINCTPGSRLKVWPYMPFERVLQMLMAEMRHRASNTNRNAMSATLGW